MRLRRPDGYGDDWFSIVIALWAIIISLRVACMVAEVVNRWVTGL